MFNDFKCNCPIYLAQGFTDLRLGIDGLATIVEREFKLEPKRIRFIHSDNNNSSLFAFHEQDTQT